VLTFFVVYFTVFLVGGRRANQGNIFASSQKFGVNLPVCGYYWTIENVS
jgi:hypothetical protein